MKKDLSKMSPDELRVALKEEQDRSDVLQKDKERRDTADADRQRADNDRAARARADADAHRDLTATHQEAARHGLGLDAVAGERLGA